MKSYIFFHVKVNVGLDQKPVKHTLAPERVISVSQRATPNVTLPMMWSASARKTSTLFMESAKEVTVLCFLSYIVFT